MRRSAFILSLCLLLGAADAIAQSPRLTRHGTLFGLGRTSLQDTYLSPLHYSGAQLMFLSETQRTTALRDSSITYQTLLQGDFFTTENPASNADILGGTLRYDLGWLFHIISQPARPSPLSSPLPSLKERGRGESLSFSLGPQIGGSIGGLYNTRNGNNPAQAILDIHLSAAANAEWRFRLWKHCFTLREQMDIPLMGLMFSPNFGQSYYELYSLNNTDHNICFTHPFNAPSLRNRLTIEIPLRWCTLQAGYLLDIRQSKVNEISRHIVTHAFLIGWTRQLMIVPQKAKKKDT
ncbi:MAG: DUF3316 domain-containing protein [Bacteroidaceae bacterium]|nr:DUF3316 domain-containing protein [Bacteroidaceae bacterium]